MNTIKNALTRGVQFLAKDQKPDGSFMCLTATKLDDYRGAKVVPAIVPPNIVLSSLIHLPETKQIQIIKKKTADFLLRERGEYWSFNYWFKNYKQYQEIPYPDDLDDTFCALGALYEYNPKLFDGEAMGKIVTMLTSAEETEGGPYNMWLVPDIKNKDWHDIDLVVNSNIAFFLHLQDITLPNLTAFIEQSIDEDDYEFPYNTIYPGIYFISRFYKGKKVSRMIELLLSKVESNGAWENPLRTALAISSLINFHTKAIPPHIEEVIARGVNYLLKTQSKNGRWKPYSFFFQMRFKEKKLYAGSASVTTALCLEAMNKFNMKIDTHEKTAQTRSKKAVESSEDHMYRAVEKKVKKRFASLAPDLKKQATTMFHAMSTNGKNKEIILLAQLFRQSLGKKGTLIDDDFITRLSLANMYGWMAYTIYDDFLDEEGTPAMLPVAQLASRESIREFEAIASILPSDCGFDQFYRDIFDTIDGANSFEVNHARRKEPADMKLPNYANYSQLAEKSIGHALGPVAILLKLGYKIHSKEVKSLMQFFTHYLIARQLDDDAHDWQEDLARGQLNAVVVEIYKGIKQKTKKNKIPTISELEQSFWRKTILSVTNRILKEIAQAKKSLDGVAAIQNKRILHSLLLPIEQSVARAQKGRKETKDFLRTYNQ